MWKAHIKIAMFSLLIFSACSGTRNLPAGEKLYTGAKVEIKSGENLKNKKEIKKNIHRVIRPKPNKTFLGMRPKVWIYNSVGETKGKGFKHWLKTKLGRPPVLMSTVNAGQTSKIIDAALFNSGFFKGYTEYKVVEKKRTGYVQYLAHVENPYKIKVVNFPGGDDLLSGTIRGTQPKSFIKTGEYYNLEILRNERLRIDASLKDNGFFYFRPDYLLFTVDTSEADKSVTLTLSIKEDTPYEALLVYRINNIFIETDYSLSDNNVISKDTLVVDEVMFINNIPNIRPKVILRSVFFKKNEPYSRTNHNMTLSRLMSMGNFKFVNVKFSEIDTLNRGFLDVFILLTPTPKRTVRIELDAVSKSNDFIGPTLTLNYKNRNSMNGAELLNFNLRGSVETQLSGAYNNVFSFEIGPQVELYIPRFVVPFKIKNPTSYYIPRTRFSISYDYLKRVNYYNLTSLQFIYGYKWKENFKTDHELNPVYINYISVGSKSPEFQELLSQNPLLAKSFQEQFIAGMTYSFTFNEQVVPDQRTQFFINFSSEFSGNTISFAKKLLTDQKPDENNPVEIAGSPYSQYSRFAVDMRNYLNITPQSKLVLRLYTGLGIAYGNSSTLPYIKQFFSGGPNSIRAFRTNSLGPGSYIPFDSIVFNTFLEQGGDIKLEGNAEYRFPLISILKGALFVDAGNIWLRERNSAIASEPFSFKTFTKEIAVGTGVGVRIDASFFVLRIDLAFPLRKPWLPDGERWVTNKVDFGSSGWRNDNLVLNIAIGYPF